MKPRLLILSPHFPPVNAPDHQRVRTMLPHLESLGWEATILAADVDSVGGASIDPLLERTIPSSVAVERLRALPLRWTRRIGMGTLGLRILPAFARRGAALLGSRRFDAVFISTAQFSVMALGPWWKRRFGMPYFLDFHDPWRAEEIVAAGRNKPGGWKYRFAQAQARLLEPAAVRGAAHNFCVSPAYPEMFRRRYPELTEDRFSVLPFGAAEQDLAVAREAAKQELFDPADGRRHLVCTGIVEEPFRDTVETLLQGVLRWQKTEPEAARRLALHFIGTTYAPNPVGDGLISATARRLGLQELVTEHRNRIPYFAALRCWLDADGLLVLGSNEAGYVPSKIEPSLLASKPILAMFLPESPGRLAMEGTGSIVLDPTGEAAEASVAEFLARLCGRAPTLPIAARTPPRNARFMTEAIVRTLNRATVSPGAA